MSERIEESRLFGDLGSLFLYDVRFDPSQRVHFNPLSDGSVELRVHTEPGFAEVLVVLNDGEARAVPLALEMRDSRFLYWRGVVEPAGSTFTYSFALRRDDNTPVYICASGVTHAVETPFVSHAAERRSFTTPAWIHGAVMYQIFPERLANVRPELTPPDAAPWGSPPTAWQFQGGDLWGIVEHLDHIANLGVDLLYLNPINTSPSTHRYDAADFRTVDPALGGDEALYALVEACHAREMRIILDASFNHCHPSFFAFQDVIEKGPDSPYWKWFTIYEWPLTVKVRPHLVSEERRRRFAPWLARMEQQLEIPIRTVTDSDGPPIEPSYDAWYNVMTMPQFNQRNPETREYFLDVARYWLTEFNIDGWRMDVVQFVDRSFWPDFRRAVKETKPDAYLLSEVWGDTSLWLQGDQFDGTMNYLFRDLCLGFFARADLPTDLLVEGLTRLHQLYAPQVIHANQNLISSHDVPRFLHESGERPERLRLATFFQLTMPGVPSIYYGDEVGLSGGHDPDNRRSFPWDAPESWDRTQLALTADLAHLRRRHPALRRGDWRPLWMAEEALAFSRTRAEEEVVVLLRRAGDEDTFHLPVPTTTPQVLYGGDEVTVTPEAGGLRVSGVAPWSGVVVAP